MTDPYGFLLAATRMRKTTKSRPKARKATTSTEKSTPRTNRLIFSRRFRGEVWVTRQDYSDLLGLKLQVGLHCKHFRRVTPGRAGVPLVRADLAFATIAALAAAVCLSCTFESPPHGLKPEA